VFVQPRPKCARKVFAFFWLQLSKVIGRKKDLKKTHFEGLCVLPGAFAEAEGAVHRTALRGSHKPNCSMQPLSQLRRPQSLPDPGFIFAQKYSKWQRVKQGRKILLA